MKTAKLIIVAALASFSSILSAQTKPIVTTNVPIDPSHEYALVDMTLLKERLTAITNVQLMCKALLPEGAKLFDAKLEAISFVTVNIGEAATPVVVISQPEVKSSAPSFRLDEEEVCKLRKGLER